MKKTYFFSYACVLALALIGLSTMKITLVDNKGYRLVNVNHTKTDAPNSNPNMESQLPLSAEPPPSFRSPVEIVYNHPRPESDVLKILVWSGESNVLYKNDISSCRFPEGKKCELVTKDFYNESEAIIIKLTAEKGLSSLPGHRFPWQKWVGYETEPPPRCEIRWPKSPDIDVIRYMFNITSTFAPDSTVPYRKAYWTEPSSMIDKWKYSRLKKEGVDYTSGKKRHVAWFVSHCEVQSQRERYVRELQKYIDVDIYGQCGNYSCGSNFDREDCDETVVSTTYWFYLSFENSLCDGYVTEKLWRILGHPIYTIPVVYGFTKYNTFLPERTVINVLDYSSPKALADGLKEILINPDKFNDYIRRKLSLKPIPQKESTSPYICRLCEYLHSNRDQKIRCPDFKAYWSTENKCVHPSTLLKADFWQ